MSNRLLGVTLSIILIVSAIALLQPAEAEAHTKKNCAKWAKKTHTGGGVVKWRVRTAKCLKHNATHRTTPLWSKWIGVARCESGARWSLNSTYDGGLQFHPSTWSSAVRGTPHAKYAYAYQAPAIVQIIAAERWRKMIGGNPHSTAGWPSCGRYYRA